MGRCHFSQYFISRTQIGGKLENILNKLQKKRTVHVLLQTADLVRVGPLKETTTHFSMFLNKDTPCGLENEVIQKRSCDMLNVVNKKETAFSFVLYKIFDILYGRQILQQYQMIGEIFFRFCAKLRWKNNEYCCVVQMHGLEHTRRFR